MDALDELQQMEAQGIPRAAGARRWLRGVWSIRRVAVWGFVISMLLMMWLLSGCDPALMQGQRPKTVLGSAGGAAAGGLLSAALGGKGPGIAAGVLLGGLLGGAIGDRLDAADRAQASRATYQALEYTADNRPVPWRNPKSGHHGSVTPMRTYRVETGQYCREYTQTIYVGGEAKQGYGRACRGSDGAWEISN